MKRAILYATIFFSVITIQYFYNNYAKALEKANVFSVNKASELIGMNVKNLQNENVGRITDMALDLDRGRISYLVLSAGGFLGVGDKLFAIPLKALILSEDQENFILDVDKSKLENAPGLDQNRWPDTNSVWMDELNRYYEKERLKEKNSGQASTKIAEENQKIDADNTGINARDRSGLTLTPEDQSNTEADRALIQDIRKGLIAEESLSANAQNIKIIVIQGKVTLRGPVESAEEKEKIGAIAGQHADPENIDNQLEMKE
jgi:hyperosmotically inducible protein